MPEKTFQTHYFRDKTTFVQSNDVRFQRLDSDPITSAMFVSLKLYKWWYTQQKTEFRRMLRARQMN